jgi:hypothetical protein
MKDVRSVKPTPPEIPAVFCIILRNEGKYRLHCIPVLPVAGGEIFKRRNFIDRQYLNRISKGEARQTVDRISKGGSREKVRLNILLVVLEESK